VNFDYESTLIKELNFEKTTDELIYQMQNDKDLLGRLWAREQLEGKMEGSQDAYRIRLAILNAAEKDPFWRNRLAALSSIRENLTPPVPPGMDTPPLKLDEATANVLGNAVKDERSLIRAEAVSFLGETSDPKYAPIYLAALNDQSYSVVEAAAAAIGRARIAKAYDTLVKLANSSSWEDRIPIAGLNGLAALGDKRAFELAYKIANDKNASSYLRDTALGTVGATGKGDPRAFPMIFEKFKKGLDKGDEGVLLVTVQAIIKLADPRGQEAFDMLRVKYKDDAALLSVISFFEKQFKESIGK
jgi:hypothetical protein